MCKWPMGEGVNLTSGDIYDETFEHLHTSCLVGAGAITAITNQSVDEDGSVAQRSSR